MVFGDWQLETHIVPFAKCLKLASQRLSKLQQTLKVLVRLTSRFIKFLKTNYETASAVQLFKSFCNCSLPQVLGEIDGTQIEILKPDNGTSVDFWSRKQKYNVNTQAAVGSTFIFLDVATEFSSSIYDARLLRATKLYQDAETNITLSKPTDVIENKEVRSLLISDEANSSTSWQLKPYHFTIRLNNAQKKFNKKLSPARVTVGRPFELLKG